MHLIFILLAGDTPRRYEKEIFNMATPKDNALLTVVIKEPGELPRMAAVSNTLETMQQLVGGYIETVTICSDFAIVCNEEGRLRGLPENVDVCGYSFVGTIVFVGVRRGRFVSLDAAGIALAAKLCGGQKV